LFDKYIHSHPNDPEPIPSSGDLVAGADLNLGSQTTTCLIVGRDGLTHFEPLSAKDPKEESGSLMELFPPNSMRYFNFLEKLWSQLGLSEDDNISPVDQRIRPHLLKLLSDFSVQYHFVEWPNVPQEWLKPRSLVFSRLLESSDPRDRRIAAGYFCLLASRGA